MRNTLVAAVAVVLVGTAAAWSLVSRPATAPANAPVTAPSSRTQSPPVPASSQLPAAASAAKSPVKTGPGRMIFPDGSQAMALNGVTADVKLIWDSQPFSPVKMKVVDSFGDEWYVHEDGAVSTVKMQNIRGTMMPVGSMGRPSAELAPMHDEAQMQKEREQQQKAGNGH
jgi:hypothetical protein